MLSAALCGWIACAGLAMAAQAAELTDQQILAGADARIEKHRKADVVVTLRRPDGRPAAGVDVRIEQTGHAFLFGSNVFILGRCKTPAENEAYEKRFGDLLNYATVPFYWWAYEAERGKPDYARTDRMVSWCHARGIKVKGHPLMWNYHDPKWLPDDPAEIRRLQLQRIADCMKRFAGKIDFWDVVNEATDFERPQILKNCPKLTAAIRAVGRMEFVRQCFQIARRADPDAVLLINDYIVEPRYADTVIRRLVDDYGRRLYDIIGIQCHQHGGAWGARHAWEICERFAVFGVPLHFTEATILSGQQGWDLCATRPAFDWVSTPEGEARQTRDVVRFYTVLFSHPAVEGITWWDFADAMAWQRAPAGFLRRDMTPKPAYDALHKLVKGRWWTTVSVTSDDQGHVPFRGFYGTYRATFTIDGRQREQAFAVRKNTDNRVEIRTAGP